MSNRLALIVSDVDGTLVEFGGMAPSERLIAAVAAARAAGVHFALASGRTWEQVCPLSAALHLEGDIAICCQGAQIVQISTYDVRPKNLRLWTMDLEIVKELIRWARDHELRPSVVVEGRYHWQVGDRLPETMNFGADGWAEVADLEAATASGVQKFMAYGAAAQIDQLLGEAKSRFGARTSLFRGGQTLLECTALGADKGTALGWLMARLGLTAAQTAALGDGDNDESLFARAGYRIAVGEHSPTLRALAHRTSEGPAHDGAAKAIEWLLENQSLPQGTLIDASFD